MIKVTVGNNLKRNSVIIDETRTLKSVLEEQEIDFARGGLTLDGATLAPGEINKTFAEMGVTEACYLLQVIKADNA